MTPGQYAEALRACRGWEAEAVSHAASHEEVRRVGARSGIYLAVDQYGALDYIGSAARAADGGLASRILHHSSPRRRRWAAFRLILLRAETPTWIVRGLEGDLIERLRPPGNRQRHTAVWVPRYEEYARHPEAWAG